MHDDDWMIPRRLHTVRDAGPEERSDGDNLQIDADFLQQRASRKQRLPLQPTRPTTVSPWLDADRPIAHNLPGFSERMWTLGDMARWVIERTTEAVDGLSIDEERLLEVLPEIHKALCDGEVCGFATTATNPIPSELPAATWSVYQLLVEEKNGLIQIYPADPNLPGFEQQLLNLRVRSVDVVRRWPPSLGAEATVQPTTAGAENRCRQWLVAMMTSARSKPRPKSTVFKEATEKFPELGKRGFDRAWSTATREAKAPNWAAPGRRSGPIESPQ